MQRITKTVSNLDLCPNSDGGVIVRLQLKRAGAGHEIAELREKLQNKELSKGDRQRIAGQLREARERARVAQARIEQPIDTSILGLAP